MLSCWGWVLAGDGYCILVSVWALLREGLCTVLDRFFPSWKITSPFQTSWEFLVSLLLCGKMLLRVMCLGKPLIAGFGKALVRGRGMVAARKMSSHSVFHLPSSFSTSLSEDVISTNFTLRWVIGREVSGASGQDCV